MVIYQVKMYVEVKEIMILYLYIITKSIFISVTRSVSINMC